MLTETVARSAAQRVYIGGEEMREEAVIQSSAVCPPYSLSIVPNPARLFIYKRLHSVNVSHKMLVKKTMSEARH